MNLYGLIVSADPAKVSGPAVELVGHNNVFVDGITDCYATAVRVEEPGQQAVTLAGSRQPGQWRRFRWCVNSPTLTIEDGDPPPGAHAKREGYHQALGQEKLTSRLPSDHAETFQREAMTRHQLSRPSAG